MTTNNDLDLTGHPIFGNRPAVAKTINPKINKEEARKKRLIWSGVGLALLSALVIGLEVSGAGIINWPGEVWQALSQSQFGESLGAAFAGQTPWIMARVGGIMAYLTSFASVVLGLMMTLKWQWVRRYLKPPTTFYLHKILALLSLSFLALHLSGLLLDNYVKISLLQTLVPFSTDSYRPLWTGLGTLVLYLSGLVVVTAYLAKKLGYKTWRTVHYLTFGIFALSLAHGIMAGTDTSSLWMQIVYVASGLLVAGLTATRFLARPERKTATAQA